MNILCYGVSPDIERQHCEFFLGVGCNAEWATDLDTALFLLSANPFESVVFGQEIPKDDCNRLVDMMRAIRPNLMFFSLAAMTQNTEKQQCRDLMGEQDTCSPLAAIYTKLCSRGSSCEDIKIDFSH